MAVQKIQFNEQLFDAAPEKMSAVCVASCLNCSVEAVRRWRKLNLLKGGTVMRHRLFWPKSAVLQFVLSNQR